MISPTSFSRWNLQFKSSKDINEISTWRQVLLYTTVFLLFPSQGLTMITQAQLKSLVTYCPYTGNFTWNGHSSGHNAGDIVGRNARVGNYIVINLNGKAYNLHRLVFLYMTGELPSSSLFVDHINGIPSDNRLENLRLCTPQQNAFNSRPAKNDTTGVKGISRIDRPGRLPHYKSSGRERMTS